MMGCRTGSQDQLFYSFNLDEHIPHNHLLRGIDRCLDLSELRQHLADYYSHTGRPVNTPKSVPPITRGFGMVKHAVLDGR